MLTKEANVAVHCGLWSASYGSEAWNNGQRNEESRPIVIEMSSLKRMSVKSCMIALRM